MAVVTLTKIQARRLILSYQGLRPQATLSGKEGILEYISRVGCIQFDPLNIVGHNHELVLQSRIRDFRSNLLQELLYQDRNLLDGWDKNMSIYPVEDWPFFERRRRVCLDHYMKRSEEVTKALPLVRKTIENRGPISSKDLGLNQSIGWSWAPTRLARAVLESMYFWGELVVHHRVGTRKY